jgi:glutathione peroxidase-family protein
MRKLLFGVFALALCAAPLTAGEFNKVLSVGDKAPAMVGIPASTPDGQDASLTLSDIKEDVVVIVFLANHCPVVTAYEDRISDFTNDYKGKSVKVVGIACSGSGTRKADDLAAIKARAVKDKKFNYVYGFDESQATGKAYGAANTPSFFVLDKARTIRYMGALDDNQNEGKVAKTYVRDAVDALLAGKEVTTKETRPVGCGIQYEK